MELWTMWLNAIHHLLEILTSQVGLGAGLGIVALTVLLRTSVLPLTWSIAYRGAIRQKKMLLLQPQLAALKREFADRPEIYAARVMQLCRDGGISVMDWRGVSGAVIQFPLLLGVYQTLKAGVDGARFLWAESLSKPDPWFAVLAGLSTMLVMFANPDLPENLRLLLLIVPSVLLAITALKLCSALAVYWSVSNLLSALQTFIMHALIGRRIKSGAIVI
jgi:YidC/Oxa1 family membrane protein insertase